MKFILSILFSLVVCTSLFAQEQTQLMIKQDTVTVHRGELVIKNTSQDSVGVLVNLGGGRTAFKRVRLINIGDTAIAIAGQDTLQFRGAGAGGGKSVQFKTGVNHGYPVEGDSIFTSIDFIGHNVKVWRNGIFQYSDPEDGIGVDSSLGKITFRPPLLQNDRVYIEALPGVKLQYDPIPPTGYPLVNIQNAVVNLPTSSVLLTGHITENGATITAYEWTQVSGPNTAVIANPSASSTNISDLTNGVFIFRLRVTTAGGIQVANSATVSVFPDNGGLKTMRVNFSHTPAPLVPGWLNVHGPVTNNHVVKTDPVTSWTVENGGAGLPYWAGFGGHNSSDTAGTTTGNNSGVVPDIVLKSFWFNYSLGYNNVDNLLITGLDPAKTYTLKFVAARSAGQAPPLYGNWYINGGAAITQNAYLNTSNQSVVNNVVPDANGKIKIGVFRNADGGTYGALSFLNALIVQEE